MRDTVGKLAHALLRRAGVDLVRYPRVDSWEWVIRDVLRNGRVSHVLDVGGHVGEFGLKLRRLGYAGAIVSFEPVPESFDQLARVAASDERWTPFPLALGMTDGERMLHVASNNVFSSFLDIKAESLVSTGGMSQVTREEKVQIRRLESIWDQVVGQNGHSVFLKSDTQGYDLHVLRGAGRCLKDICGIQIELPIVPLYEDMTSFDSAVAQLAKNGFGLRGIFPAAEQREGWIIEVDCVFSRRQQRNDDQTKS